MPLANAPSEGFGALHTPYTHLDFFINQIGFLYLSAKNPPNPFYASLLLSFLATLFFITGSRE
jgi:hypothetical protein